MELVLYLCYNGINSEYEGETSLESSEKRVLYVEYKLFLVMCLLFTIMAFVFDKPGDIIQGLGQILSQHGLLITDYMVVGGLGAAIINSTLVSLYGVAVLYFMRAKPCGAAIMSLWMAAGNSYWGANVLNILPLTCGVWLFSRYKRAPFSDYMVAALLCHAIAPIVSIFYVSNPIMLHLDAEWHFALNILIGTVVGLICGFIVPAILSAVVRLHDGYTLYNMGVAGGMIAIFFAAGFKGAGINVPIDVMWYTDRQVELAVFLYVIFATLIVMGFFPRVDREKKYLTWGLRPHNPRRDAHTFARSTGEMNPPCEPKPASLTPLRGALRIRAVLVRLKQLVFSLCCKGVSKLSDFKKLIAHSGHAPNDYYELIGSSAYINMGLLGIIGTTWALGFGLDLTSGTFACIFSMTAFGCLGKHIKNVMPLLIGATICAFVNTLDFTSPTNTLAILFSTCLAPIAGKYGIGWGMVAGFLHVLTVIHMGPVTNGFNLYNNGFCSGFIALFLVPIIAALKRKKI